MDAVVGAEEIRRLGQRKWREGVVSSEEVTEIFRRIHDVLVHTHEQNVIIGDLNDGNVLFSSVNPWFIDTDSMQFGSYRCHVAHEKYLDPRLYGVDLAQTTAFTEDTDWYAYTVLLFSSLLYVHPYGGVHPGYPTALRRAEAAWSVLRPDVRYPRVAEPFDVLTDELLDWFAGVFDRGRRERFPRDLLDIHWTRCRCGLPPLEGHLFEASAIFDRGRVLFQSAVENRGRVTSSLYVIDAAGELCASVTGDPDSRPELALDGGKAMVGDCILCPTDDGLLSFRIDAGTGKIFEGHLYRETEAFIDAGASLLPGPGGSVYVVRTTEIGLLTLARQPQIATLT